jgi:hypothetical protein
LGQQTIRGSFLDHANQSEFIDIPPKGLMPFSVPPPVVKMNLDKFFISTAFILISS